MLEFFLYDLLKVVCRLIAFTEFKNKKSDPLFYNYDRDLVMMRPDLIKTGKYLIIKGKDLAKMTSGSCL